MVIVTRTVPTSRKHRPPVIVTCTVAHPRHDNTDPGIVTGTFPNPHHDNTEFGPRNPQLPTHLMLSQTAAIMT